MQAIDLHELRVLVTRPAELADGLRSKIETVNGVAVYFPAIEFGVSSNTAALENALNILPQFDWAVFVSIPAVRQVARTMHHLAIDWPHDTSIAVVGRGSARVCHEEGLAVMLMPENRQSSEGLIEAFNAIDLRDRQVVIFRGQSGRELLGEYMHAQGAHVSTIESYQRQITTQDPGAVITLLADRKLDVIVISSQSIFDALLELFGNRHDVDLMHMDLVAVSDRVANYCRNMGVQGTIEVSASAGDEDIVCALSRLVRGKII